MRRIAFAFAVSCSMIALGAAAANSRPPAHAAADSGPGETSGPLVLRAALQFFGIAVPDYDALVRECGSTTDTGTSIDDLETVANRRGLRAAQTMAPIDDLLELPEALPAIIIVKGPRGLDFRLLMKAERTRAQVLDPRVGDRWMPLDELRRTLHIHEQVIPTAQWRAFARSSDRTSLLSKQLTAIAGAEGTNLLARAFADSSDEALQRLDAAVRATRQRQQGKDALFEYWQDGSRIPADAWFAKGAGAAGVRLRGTVFVTLLGRSR